MVQLRIERDPALVRRIAHRYRVQPTVRGADHQSLSYMCGCKRSDNALYYGNCRAPDRKWRRRKHFLDHRTMREKCQVSEDRLFVVVEHNIVTALEQ